MLPHDNEDDVNESLDEMEQLLWTAGAETVCQVVQQRSKPCPGTLIGSGKAEEIRRTIEELEIDLAAFDSDLTPAQNTKLEDILGVRVLDRTQLILDIFAQRAQTSEGKLQVELAQLKYTLPRLTGHGKQMARLSGGIGARHGAGEQKLEIDRRTVRQRIQRLQRELEQVRKTRRVQRKKRTESAVVTAALVGYTNAGKSSLLRALTHGEVFVEDKLFATLDPTNRRCALPSGRMIILSDTVGFIRSLPHQLVAAFRATLEEVHEADLLILVADASHPSVADQIAAVYDVLDDMGVTDKPIITVFNKQDITPRERLHELLASYPGAIALSAQEGTGLANLLEAIDAHLEPKRRLVRLRIPQHESALAAQVHREGRVLDEHYEDNDIVLQAELEPQLHDRLADYEE